MRKALVTLFALALLPVAMAGCRNEGGTPLSIADDALDVAYEKYTLDNGLEVVLHQDRSDPIVAIATLMHVGSGREKTGRTGFAHFFEHMSFNDSENVPQGSNRQMIPELGGERNGGTWTDGTIFYEVVPKDALEKLMWIDSDRLGYMINTVTETALENEKKVVKNEKREREDNQPYGHVDGVIRRNLYPEGHPYSWTVLGSMADLQAATLDDVREFYDRYYGPGNATLALCGDFEMDEAKALVDKWFGEIAPREPVDDPAPAPVTLAETRSVFHVDNFAELPELRLTFPTVEQFHEDAYALDVLAQLLADGKRAPLYRTIVEERKLAPAVYAFHNAGEQAGTLTLLVRANAGVDLDAVREAVVAAVDDFAENGFLDKDLERIKALQETDFLEGVEGVLDKAFQLAIFNEFAGDPGFFGEHVVRMRGVSRGDVERVFDRYLRGRHHVATSFVPREGEELALADAVRAEVVEEPAGADDGGDAGDAAAAAAAADYPRTPTAVPRTEPPLGAEPLLTPPAVWTDVAGCGLRLYGLDRDELPLVRFSLRLRGGHALDDPALAGAAQLTADLMMEGTRNLTPAELEDALGVLGAEVDIYATSTATIVEAGCLARNFPAVVSLVEEMLLEPRWDEQEFARLKERALTTVRQREGNPEAVATMAWYRRIYGPGHPLGLPTGGTEETLTAITLDDLKSFWESNFSPTIASFHVAGDVRRDEVVAALASLDGRWTPREVVFPELPAPPQRDQPELCFVDVPGAKQSVLRVGRLVMPGVDPDYYRLTAVNSRLGSGSSGRLFQNLRIQRGYTYGAYGVFLRREAASPYLAYSSVRTNITLEAVSLLRDLVRDYGATFSEEDLAKTKNKILKDDTRRFETLGDLLEMLQDIAAYDLPLDFVAREQAQLAALTLDDARGLAGRWFDPARMVFVVVGDAATQRDRLAELGYGPPLMLDRSGEPAAAGTGG